MSSLTYTSYVARNTIKYGGAGLILFTVLWMGMTAAIKAYIAAHPPYIPPNVKYGILPKIVFSDKTFSPKTFTTQLPNDNFPVYKDQARVYFIARPNSTFLALDNDKVTAQALGFVSDPVETKEGIYQFSNTVTNTTLTMNVVDDSFELKYPYETDQMLLNPDHVPDKTEAFQIAHDFLSQASKLPDDLDAGQQVVTFWKIQFDGLTQVSSQSEANAARVDFFRQKLEDTYPILSVNFNEAPISALVTGSSVDGKKVIQLDYRYANIDRESYATYPIITPQAAFAQLQAGNYWPAMDSKDSSTVIRKIYLAYFEPVTLTNFLQPIYVFEGDNKFAAYVPAVTSDYAK